MSGGESAEPPILRGRARQKTSSIVSGRGAVWASVVGGQVCDASGGGWAWTQAGNQPDSQFSTTRSINGKIDILHIFLIFDRGRRGRHTAHFLETIFFGK